MVLLVVQSMIWWLNTNQKNKTKNLEDRLPLVSTLFLESFTPILGDRKSIEIPIVKVKTSIYLHKLRTKEAILRNRSVSLVKSQYLLVKDP